MNENPFNLSANSLTVLKRRYLAKNEKGEPRENPGEMFARVAKNIAKADLRYDSRKNLKETEEKFYNLMTRLEFLPNSPTLMNAGRELQQLSACFVKGQKILSNPGYKDIEQIQAGDRVVTDKGRTGKVTELHRRAYKGDIYTVNVQGMMKPTLNVTGEHPVLAIKKEKLICKRAKNNRCNGFVKKYCLKTPEEYKDDCMYINRTFKAGWIPAKELKEGDFVAVNTNREIKDTPEINTEDYVSVGIYFKKGKYLTAKGRPNKGKKIPSKIKIDNNFLRLTGYWLADGSISKTCGKYGVIRFTFNAKEKRFCEDVKKIMKKKFNLTAKEEFTEKQKTIQLRFNSIIVAELFFNLFGKGFDGKKLPAWMITLPLKKQFHLAVGLFRGDGCYFKREKQDVIFVSLSNKRLASDIWGILLRLGYNFNINHRMPSGGTKEAYRISAAPSECKELAISMKKGQYRERKIFPQYIKTGDIILRPISKIETALFDGEVYNLEVEKDHSYLANGVAVHNCFVLPIEDSMGSIFQTIKDTALIHQTGGGTGFSFSRLRPKNSRVRSTGGVASGPISFMKVFNAATQAVIQGGTRRGANMGILRVDHPDILEFIKCKENDKDITNFNISVAVTEDFMKKVKASAEYDLVDPHTEKAVQKLNAREVFDLIIRMAWKNGEPGIIFIDRMNQFNPTPKIGIFESTNPCGEQNLLPYESCNLGSINLSRMITDGKIDWEKISRATSGAVHFLDNVIDMNRFPLPEIEKITMANRKIGLGVMGFADMLIDLGIAYNSEEAVHTADKLMAFILKEARSVSSELAETRGVFPNFEKSIYSERSGSRFRNATVTTIAPTGTLSIIAGCSSGIEPLFAIMYYKEVMDKDKLPEVNEQFEKIAKDRGFWSEELLKKIAKKGNIQELKEVPEDVRKLFVTSHDITPEWHIRIQAAFQKYTDNAVSKTINFANSAKKEDIENTYMLAHELGCKGVTVYRDGSRAEQVLNIEKKEKTKDGEPRKDSQKIIPRPRPSVISGTTTKIATGCGNLYVTINEDEEQHPFEVFMQMGKAGGCAMSQLEAIGRLLSLALRSGIEIKSVIEQLRGIRCPSPSWEKGGRIFSCSDAIARVVEQRLLGKAHKKEEPLLEKENTSSPAFTGSAGVATKKKTGNIVGVCPDCGGALWHVEGCMVCRSCGYSKCG